MKKWNGISVAIGLCLFLLYTAGGALSIEIRSLAHFVALLWIPSGVGLAALYLFGGFLWPVIAVSSFCISFFFSQHAPFSALMIAIGCSLESYWGAYFLQRYASKKLRFSSTREVFVFILFVMFFMTGISSILETVGVYFEGVSNPEDLIRIFRSWWLSQAIGNLVIGAGFIYLWNEPRRWRELVQRKWEVLALVVVLSIYCVLIFTRFASYNTYLLVRPYVLFSLMTWIAIRFDVIGVIIANFIIVLTVVWGCVQNYVAFATYAGPDYSIMLQLYATAIATTGLVLAAAVREKSDVLEFRNEFLGIASHELKTPITSLKLNLQLLERRLQGVKDAPESLVFLGKIDKQINRLVQIVEQLLDVSQADRRKISLHLEEVNFRSLLDSVVERLRGELEQSRCSIEIEADSGLKAHWDPFRIEQVLENLISNAIKYAPAKLIRIIAVEKGAWIEIAVIDQGPGIEASMQRQIFDRFVRASVNTHVKGLGLGLFITRGIVEAHGGKIGVKSKLGSGSSFVVTLPG